MSWKYPKHNLENPNVVGMDDVNENFRAVVEEVSGELNEHNWKRRAFSERAMLADDAGIVLHKKVVEADPTTGVFTPGCHRVLLDKDWQLLAGMEITFTTTGGTHWLLASLQATSPFDWSAFGAGGAGRWGIQFALSLNGAVLAQSIIGSADLTNDLIETFQSPSPVNIGFITINTPAPSSAKFSVVSEAIIDVPPGKHTVRFLAAPPKAADLSGATLSNTSKWVGTRELIVAELLR